MDNERFQKKLAKFRAMVRARDEAGRTPLALRRVFLGLGQLEHARFQQFTLGALWLLEEIEHPLIVKPMPNATQAGRATTVLLAAFILAKSEEARDAIAGGRAAFDRAAVAFSREFQIADLPALLEEVKRCVELGFATMPGGGGSKSSGVRGAPEKNSGLGWTVTLLDTLLSGYTWPGYQDHRGVLRSPVDFVVWKVPLSQAFVLYTATAARNGIQQPGANYVEKAMIEAGKQHEAEAAAA